MERSGASARTPRLCTLAVTRSNGASRCQQTSRKSEAEKQELGDEGETFRRKRYSGSVNVLHGGWQRKEEGSKGVGVAKEMNGRDKHRKRTIK